MVTRDEIIGRAATRLFRDLRFAPPEQQAERICDAMESLASELEQREEE